MKERYDFLPNRHGRTCPVLLKNEDKALLVEARVTENAILFVRD